MADVYGITDGQTDRRLWNNGWTDGQTNKQAHKQREGTNSTILFFVENVFRKLPAKVQSEARACLLNVRRQTGCAALRMSHFMLGGGLDKEQGVQHCMNRLLITI